MARSPHWLEPLVSEARGLGRALIVCRTTASQREVLRAFAGPVLCQSMSSNKVQNALRDLLVMPEVRRAVEALLVSHWA
jgi:hypothetical protein